jgi:hypothetical protein
VSVQLFSKSHCRRWAKRTLRRQIGLASNEDISFFFDQHSVAPGDHLDLLKQRARNSAAFVAVVSPSYVVRDWTREEVAAFNAGADPTGRIFAIESTPLDRAEDYPEPFRSLAREAFWRRKNEREYLLSHKDEAWDAKIQDVARAIKIKLRELKEASGPRPAVNQDSPPTVSVSPDPRRTVLLAQVTEDLDEDRSQVRRYLEQFGLAILPASTYPQGGPDFSRAFEADLAKANAFVQLLSRVGRCPSDLSQGYARYQYEAAVKEIGRRPKFTTLIWRRPDHDLAALLPADKALLSVPEICAMGLEQFKAEIVREIENASAPERPERRAKPAGDINVFINADREDIDLAHALQTDFQRHGCTATLPLFDGDARELTDDLEENIVSCNALALVYGRVRPLWIRSQARHYCKLKPKRTEQAHVLICRDGTPKPDHGVALPEMIEIDYVAGAEHDPLKDIVTELRR